MRRTVELEKSLQYRFPEIAKQWHPLKNGDLLPSEIGAKSTEKMWWYLPFDDPRTGKHFDFEWQSSVISRTQNNVKCPFLSGQAVWVGFNDLESVCPEIALQWHPTKNGEITPRDVTYGSEKEVWWMLPYDEPSTGKHFDFEWKSKVYQRTYRNSGCPFLTGKAVWPGFNDLESAKPELASQWHPTKNGDLKPSNVMPSSNKKVWWMLSYDDPMTGRHFDFEWIATINSRFRDDVGCPFLSGKAVKEGFNDLATLRPDIAAQWHPTRNGRLKPTEVAVNCMKKVWWLMPYDDPKTGKHFEFEWDAVISSRTRQDREGCPFLCGRAIWPGFNDLATIRPDIAIMWHPTRNGKLKPTDITVESNKKVWWYLAYDDPNTGRHYDFEWKAAVCERVREKCLCPYLVGKRVWKGFNDLESIFPEIAKEWDYKKNKVMTPTEVTAFSSRKAWWICPTCGDSWRTVIRSRVKGHGHNCKCA